MKPKNIDTQHMGLSENLKKKFAAFLENYPPGRVSQNLRRLFVEFNTYEYAAEYPHLADISRDLQGVFDLLDFAERERRST